MGDIMKQVFAIGDIHGRFDLLTSLMTKIKNQANDGDKIVFLGDYIDRGPQSKDVLDYLMNKDNFLGLELITLMGNHERFMIDSYGPLSDYNYHSWMLNGGQETLDSFDWNDELVKSYIPWL